MIELKDYQSRAVKSLKGKVQNLLRSSENEIVVFQSPTGSGKTVMVSEMLKQLVKDNHKRYSFIWVSVRQLHEQSKEKLEKYYEDDRLIQCSYFEDLEDKKIGENEILFLNWHSINKKDINLYVKDNEQDNNLNCIIENTKEEDREIILVIDESHHTAKSEKSRELIETISPTITIEVSATPHLKENVSEIERISLSDVKAEEMIKSEISINPEFIGLKVDTKSSDELIIEIDKKENPSSQTDKTNVETFWQIIELMEKGHLRYGGLMDAMKRPVIEHLRTKYEDNRDRISKILGFKDKQSLPNEIYRLGKV